MKFKQMCLGGTEADKKDEQEPRVSVVCEDERMNGALAVFCGTSHE